LIFVLPQPHASALEFDAIIFEGAVSLMNSFAESASWRGIDDPAFAVKDEINSSFKSRRFAARQFRKRAFGHGSQFIQGHIAVLCGLHQALGKVLAAFMIAAMWQVAADFLQYHVHVRGCALTDLRHSTLDHC
jgi:hypothetical protein